MSLPIDVSELLLVGGYAPPTDACIGFPLKFRSPFSLIDTSPFRIHVQKKYMLRP